MLLWRNCCPHNNKTYLGIQVQCAIFVSDFNQFWSFSTISNFPPVSAALMQVDRQAVGQTKLTGPQKSLERNFNAYFKDHTTPVLSQLLWTIIIWRMCEILETGSTVRPSAVSQRISFLSDLISFTLETSKTKMCRWYSMLPCPNSICRSTWMV